MAKSTRDQGYAEGIDRILGVTAEEPSIDFLEGLEAALLKGLTAVQERKATLIALQAADEWVLDDDEIDAYANDWKGQVAS